MYKIVSKLLMYGDMPKDSILMQLSDIFKQMDQDTQSRDELVTRIFTQVKHLLQVATDYGFDKNLWHNYLTYLLITDENPFSLTCEKVGANDGSVNFFAKGDFKAFKALFDFDFSEIEERLGIDCFTRLSQYKAIGKKELMYNKNVSEKVQALSERLEKTANEDEFFDVVTDFYKAYGVGMFGLNKAFRIASRTENHVEFCPINNMDTVMLDDLVGYEIQKKKLVDNTEAFVQGRKANNVLLFGDSDLHRSDTMEEKLSLVNRFGVQISYSKPSKKEFNEIVIELARRVGLTMTDEELCAEANKWEMRHGGISGRTAQQFINYLQGTVEI